MKNDREILREVAKEYKEIMNDKHNADSIIIQKSVNDLHMIRPALLINELPWRQLNFNGELTLQCESQEHRKIEEFMRRELFRFRYLRGDMVVRPFYPVMKIASSSGFGVEMKEDTIMAENTHIMSHEYMDMFSSWDDLDKMRPATVTYDEVGTNKTYDFVNELFGDIIPVKKVGRPYANLTCWDWVSMFRGVTPVLMDLLDEPEFSHALIKKVFDYQFDEIKQMMELGLFDEEASSVHHTCGYTDDLKPIDPKTNKLQLENVWGRGAAQIFASVSKEMRDEFDIEYMINTIGNCGLVYYGCCEQLDTQIDIVEKIPNLRKITMTPWANVDVGAEAIGKRYVMAAKPNPSAVGSGKINEDEVRKEISSIIKAGKRNGCSFEFALKDISTCSNNAQALLDWYKITWGLINSY